LFKASRFTLSVTGLNKAEIEELPEALRMAVLPPLFSLTIRAAVPSIFYLRDSFNRGFKLLGTIT
jgi:hypothetical protein